jgi:putative FmdB family regulatory protein
MPTYEYECQKCHHRHEAFQSITAKPLTSCPRCRGRLKRLMGSGSGFLFKGKGFYITDYRSKSYHEAKKKDEQASQPPSKPSTPSTTHQ